MQIANYKLTKVSQNDVDALVEIAKSTFISFFKEFNSPENLNNYVSKAFSYSTITAEIANPNSQFYFATYNATVVGYLKVNFGPAQTELQDHTSLELERIYVIDAFIGKNVGQFLFNKVVDIATKNQLKYIWLGVWEHNPRAIRFYEKQNFVKFDTHVFKMGNDDQTDYLLKLIL